MRRVTCECGQVVTRREQKRHKKSVCEFTKIGCPLKCGQEVERYVYLDRYYFAYRLK